MNSFLAIAESLLLLLALPMSPKSKAATGSNASIKCWNLDRAMSNARAYMMVYRLSVVSEYHFVLVMNEGRSGGGCGVPECNLLGILLRLMVVVEDVLPT